MSHLKNWAAACAIGLVGVGVSLGMPARATADDSRLVVTPAVVQTTDPSTAVTVQPVAWRRGWGPGVGVGVYRGGWGPGAGVYVAPRPYYGPRYYAAPYYGGYYRPYRAYAYPGYAPYGYYW